MANPYASCGKCLGNMWPPGQQLKEHDHIPSDVLRTVLKLKYRVRKLGWNKAANPRTNSPGNKSRKTLRPRRKSYGPF